MILSCCDFFLRAHQARMDSLDILDREARP